MWGIMRYVDVKKAPDRASEYGFVVDLSCFQSPVYGCDRL